MGRVRLLESTGAMRMARGLGEEFGKAEQTLYKYTLGQVRRPLKRYDSA